MTTMKISNLFTLVAISCLGAACGGGADPDPIATVIEFSPTTLNPADDAGDDLTIRVDYADGDGDLGEGIAQVHDCRVAGVVVEFDLPKIASDEAVEQGVPIEGSLEITVADVSDLAPDATPPAVCSELGAAAQAAGEAVFCVVLVDVAGNSGEGDCTGTVSITP